MYTYIIKKVTLKTSKTATLLSVSLVIMCLLSFKIDACLIAEPPGISEIGFVGSLASSLKCFSVGNFQQRIFESEVEI